MAVRELFPPIWWGLYVGLQEQGFTKDQALQLVKTYILAYGTSHPQA